MKDKAAHAFVYCVFGLLLFRSFSTAGRPALRPVLLALVVGVAYGALDEFHQYFIPGRDCDFYDFLADTAGMGLAVVVRRLFHISGA